MEIGLTPHTSRDNWGQFASDMDAAVATTMREAAARGSHIAEGLAPEGLRGSFEYWPSGRLEWSWGSGAEWAHGLNDGIPPHIIGRPGQFLYNRQEGTGPGGAGHFRARGPVRHPGVLGSHFMERSFDAVAPDVPRSLREQIARDVRGY